MWRYLFGFLLTLHGLAHVTGLLGFWTSGPQALAEKPWLFSRDITPRCTVGRLFGFLWLVAGIGLVGAGLGLLFGQDWWPVLATAAAVVSLAAIIPWTRVVPPGAWGGVAIDLLILIALLPPWADRIVAALA